MLKESVNIWKWKKHGDLFQGAEAHFATVEQDSNQENGAGREGESPNLTVFSKLLPDTTVQWWDYTNTREGMN